MILRELLDGVDVISDYNGQIDIKGIKYDSRKVTSGDAFLCIKGFSVDGHRFAQEAVENGASVVIAQDDVAVDGAEVVMVRDTRIAMARIAANFYGHPSKDFVLIGVTGTNGKTTVTNIIRWVLRNLGYSVGLIGTINIAMDDEEIPSIHTTPESVDLQRIFKEMKDRGAHYVVMEVSSHSLALHRVDQCDFDVAVFTNLTQDHLDFHKTMEEYMKAKMRLFKMTKKSIVNVDDDYSDFFVQQANKPLYTYGINGGDFRARNVVMTNGVEFDLYHSGFITPIKFPIPGKFSVYNALAAIATLSALGFPVPNIAESLSTFPGVKGRCELVNCGTPYKVVIDYAHTPDGLENILKSVREFTINRLIVVFGCGGDRDKAKRPKMGEIAIRYADYTIITTDNPRSEDPQAIISDILKGINGNEDKYKVIVDRKEAIKYALGMAKEGDVVLLAGKGHETYQILRDKTIPFDEREIVKSIVGGKNV
ncbi:UDP-N-acetylmuramoylalanyl-D-glutamate--2,6-diaminopimelate ligase [Caldanaerobius fijiensis DSM 17918]|uniref:UDP-N-acetylmuramoyl-L-alanyl-D-glutamate--2,6-diaminopimelate ligase n=1 Tax=Caldanaerobius fijiensis DSM 17918 TaxID=1121256 RepID=A0A1M4T2T6_9THEO|nr:UDP-N-acetylmuramoyl-L-alanyl-D-glutamate--2,6-diaminopimelate ligase [Caldanaerobius fijiensis]SHE38776.1 UDP-N-acetylmuramoylalanyl-D-glutamate--2,6-diaminopimelate ligase [Caldanaerobius fijiensis DSM 17918]